MANKKVLILFAHPSQHRSEVNTPLFKEAQKIEGVTCVDLYGEYLVSILISTVSSNAYVSMTW